MKEYNRRKLLLLVAGLVWIIIGAYLAVGDTLSLTKVKFDSGEIMVNYSSETELITITHDAEEKRYQIQLSSRDRMGVLIEVDGSEFNYSLRFLEEDQKWPPEELVEKKTLTSKSVTKLPGWVICIIEG